MTTGLRHLHLSAAALVATAAFAAPVLAQTTSDQPASPGGAAQAATPTPTPAPPPAVAPPTATTPSTPPDTPAGKIPPPPAGKGQIVFFRPWAYPGMAVSFSVHEGQTGVGKLGVSSYFVYIGDPGPHTFTIQSESTDTLNTEIEAGETTFVKETLGMGLMLYRPHLTPSDEDTFNKVHPHVSSQKATDLAASEAKTADAKPAATQ
jgi:hypothetical protein